MTETVVVKSPLIKPEHTTLQWWKDNGDIVWSDDVKPWKCWMGTLEAQVDGKTLSIDCDGSYEGEDKVIQDIHLDTIEIQ